MEKRLTVAQKTVADEKILQCARDLAKAVLESGRPFHYDEDMACSLFVYYLGRFDEVHIDCNTGEGFNVHGPILLGDTLVKR